MNNKYLKWFRDKASIGKNRNGNNSSQNDEDSNKPATLNNKYNDTQYKNTI